MQRNTNELSYAPGANALADDYSVLMCYQLLLGRDPENSFVIQEAKTQPIHALLHSFINSKEFMNQIVAPIRRGARFAHEKVSRGPSLEQKTWLAGMFVMDEPVREALLASSSWRQTMDALLCLPGFPALALQEKIEPGAASAAETTGRKGEDSLMFGRIEGVTGQQLRGWAADLRDDTAIEIELMAGATSLGRVRCDRFRLEAKLLFGTAGCVGFAVDLPDTDSTGAFPELEVHAIACSTGAIIIPPTTVTLMPPTPEQTTIQLQETLQTVSMQFNRLSELLQPPSGGDSGPLAA